jgi:hypothetical protein
MPDTVANLNFQQPFEYRRQPRHLPVGVFLILIRASGETGFPLGSVNVT